MTTIEEKFAELRKLVDDITETLAEGKKKKKEDEPENECVCTECDFESPADEGKSCEKTKCSECGAFMKPIEKPKKKEKEEKKKK